VSDKIGLILNLLPKLDRVLIGGGMAYTFLVAQGLPVGKSLVESDKVDAARDILTKATALGVDIQLPEDHVIVEHFDASAPSRIVPHDGIPAAWMGVDIGPRTVEAFAEAISEAQTVIWNGPMGVFEMPPFAKGTTGVAVAVAATTATSIVGGGDSVAAVNQAGVAERITHISTGGGAFLELLEGRELPGVTALTDKPGVES
jgi:phosphoglycerate kinase